MYIEQKDMVGQAYINATREYCDYLEEHLNNVRKAFQELSEACEGMEWVGDDKSWHGLRTNICEHDLGKFSMYEFTQYRDRFFPTEHTPKNLKRSFNAAWKHHYENNPHHSEYIYSMKKTFKKQFPGAVERHLVHMVIDWTAMSYKFGGTAQSYYETHSDKHKLTDSEIEFIYILFDKLEKYRERIDKQTNQGFFGRIFS